MKKGERVLTEEQCKWLCAKHRAGFTYQEIADVLYVCRMTIIRAKENYLSKHPLDPLPPLYYDHTKSKAQWSYEMRKKGYNPREIADYLHISYSTVMGYIRRVREKKGEKLIYDVKDTD